MKTKLKNTLLILSTATVTMLGLSLAAVPAQATEETPVNVTETTTNETVDTLSFDATASYGGYTLEEARKNILDRTNKVRTDLGLQPLKANTQLDTVAQNWSEKMANENRMYHNPNFGHQYEGNFSHAAENVAYGYGVNTVVGAWVNSPLHYANIIRPGTNEIGIGVGVSSTGVLYFTQNFAQFNPVIVPTPNPTPTPTPPVITPTPTTPPKPTTPPTTPPKPTTPPVTPTPGKMKVERLSGNDRYETSVSVTKKFATNIPVLYIANGAGYADALSAAPAAAKQGGALLLTTETTIPNVVWNEIKRLKPQRIVVVGGTGVISNNVYKQLSTQTNNIRRDAGADRYETSRIVNSRAFGSLNNVYVATGFNFPDALSASAAAGATNSAVLLVPSVDQRSRLDNATINLVKKLNPSKVFIMGGTAVVNNNIETSLKNTVGYNKVTRVAGDSRYSTTVAAMKASFSSSKEAFIATGANYADALAGAALAGKQKAPMYLSPGTCIYNDVLQDMKRLGVEKVTLLGGVGVLNGNVANLKKC